MKTRRAFLAALACLPGLRWVQPAKMAPVTIAETLALPEVNAPAVFHGSFRLGVKTSEATLSRHALARVKACTRELEKWSGEDVPR